MSGAEESTVPVQGSQEGTEEILQPSLPISTITETTQGTDQQQVQENNMENTSDQTLPDSMEIILARKAEKNASSDRRVPQGHKYFKTKNSFRRKPLISINAKKTKDVSTSPCIPTRAPLNIRLYELQYMTDPMVIEEKLGCNDENAATVPDINSVVSVPSRPFLRLGLSRRSRPGKPLHEIS